MDFILVKYFLYVRAETQENVLSISILEKA